MSGLFSRLSSYFSGGSAADGRRRFLVNVEELADGQMKEVALEAEEDGRPPLKVLLSRVQGNFYATSHLCPHYKARLVTGALSASGRLTCPWHAACFDVRTGDIEEAPSVEALRSFPLCVEDGKVYLLAADKDLAVPSRSVCGPLQLSPADLEQDGRTFVVVGGGAAGAIAAESMREAGYKGRIVVISREPHLPIDRTKLSKFLDVKPDRAALFKEPYLLDQLKIEFHLGKTATGLDREEKAICLDDGSRIRFDKLLVATGGTPRRLPIPGADFDNVCVVRELCDNERIMAACQGGKPRVVIIGASFIGMEAAAMMVRMAESVTVVGVENAPLERVLGAEVGRVLQRRHEQHGIKFRLGAGISKILSDDSRPSWASAVELSDGSQLEADLVIMGVGVRPATDFVRDCVPLEGDGSIRVDGQMRVLAMEDDAIYAAGDLATFPHPTTGQLTRVEHWDVAQQQGRIAGHNMACAEGARRRTYRSVPFFFSLLLGKSIRYAGNAQPGYDRVHIDGDLAAADPAFAAYYLAGDKVLGVATMGRDPLAVHCSELMLQGRMLSAAQVVGGTVSVRW